MPNQFSEKIIRAIEYLALPAQFPRHHFLLERLIYTNRELVSELSRLTSYRPWFSSLNIKTVIDVGAYLGSFAFAMRMMLPKVQLYCFDPLAENIALVNDNLGKWGQLETFQTALGDKRGEVEFNLNDFRASSSILEMDPFHRKTFPETTHVCKVKVPIALLDDFLPKMKMKKSILLKVDVQGFELNVLKGGIKLLSQIDYLLLEVTYQTLYKGQPLFGDIYKFLNSHGFEFAGNLDSLTSPENSAILQSDAFFIRKGK
jgi:FkbM family methyltransferase